MADSASTGVLVADREFISAEWLRRLQAEGVPFAIRLRPDRQVTPASSEAALPARLFAWPTPIGEERTIRRVRLNADPSENDLSEDDPSELLQPVDLVIKRIAPPGSNDPFVILAVWNVESERTMELYRQRWNIEKLLAALNSRGFDLEQTHLTAPEPVERLIGLLALVFLWARIVGEHCRHPQRVGRCGQTSPAAASPGPRRRVG